MAISPQIAEKNAEVKGNHKLAYPVLSDAGNAYARQLGLVHALPEDLRAVYGKFGIDLPAVNGDETWELPLATRLVVDKSGTIRKVDCGVDYTIRPEAEESVEILESL